MGEEAAAGEEEEAAQGGSGDQLSAHEYLIFNRTAAMPTAVGNVLRRKLNSIASC